MPILAVNGSITSRQRTNEERTALIRKHMKDNKRKRKNKKLLNKTVLLKSPKPKKARVRYFQLYALLLEGGNYYVGMTAYSDATVRFNQHLSAKGGAQWTRLHKPLKILETRKLGMMIEGEAARFENDMTMEYMSIYGMRKVRGGDMCRLNYNDNIGRINYHSKWVLT